MTSMTVPSAPALSHLPNVELCQTGTWNLSTGPATFTTADFMSAVAALECPAVRRPVLKLGHDGNHGVGEAAIGYIDNMRGDEEWRTLLGDYAGMPGWLATPDENGQTVIASAFPDRSIEGAWDWQCQMGHNHPFVILAVSLLGTKLPGVGTLASLQDVGRIYGIEGTPELVAASAAQDAATPSTVVIQVTASRKDGTMPNPTARTIAATVSADDVRRAFYESPVGSDWDAWIEEIQLDPLQIIYIDDDEGARYRVPITIGSGDGPDAVTFGAPVQVVIRYEDSTVAASAGAERIRYASKSESRPGQPPRAAAPQTPAEPQGTPPTEPEEADAMSDTVNQGLRERLGISAETELDDAGLLAAVDQALAERADPAPAAEPTTVPEGSVVVPRVQLEELQTAAQAGVEARTRQLTEDRDREISAAVSDGRIAPARREHWQAAYATDRVGASAALASLPKGLIPVTPTGRGEDPDAETDPATNDDYWFAGVAAPSKTAVEG